MIVPDHRGKVDTAVRASVNQMIKLCNLDMMDFYVDDYCSYIWNLHFCGDGVHKSDLDRVSCLIDTLSRIGKTRSARII